MTSAACVTHAWLAVIMAVAIMIVVGAFVEVIVKFTRWLWRHNKDGNF